MIAVRKVRAHEDITSVASLPLSFSFLAVLRETKVSIVSLLRALRVLRGKTLLFLRVGRSHFTRPFALLTQRAKNAKKRLLALALFAVPCRLASLGDLCVFA